jgi:hypothetical protein
MNEHERVTQVRPMLDTLNNAARENPVAAALIGGGIAWMLMGGTKGLALATGIATAGIASASEPTSKRARGESEAPSNAGGRLKNKVTEAAGSIVPDISVGDTLETARAAVEDGVDSLTAKGRKYAPLVRSRLADAFEQQPMLLGAVGLAIGAAIASTFGATTVEREAMGEQAARARDTLRNVAGDAKDRARRAMSEVKDEAEKQGLTPAGLKEAAESIADKAKTVAREAVDSGAADAHPR